MASHQIEIDGITVEILRKPIKNMHLRIYPPDGRVRVSAPMRLSLQHIFQQLESKREWLHAQRARMQAQPVITELLMQTGELHYFLGKAFPLFVVESHQSTSIKLIDHRFVLITKKDSSLHTKQVCLKNWYKEQIQVLIANLIEKWEPVIGVSVSSWGTKTMKTRWGSCNTRARRIWLNLVLIQKPIECLEYVLVHEMIHLLEASHNARFYQLMNQFLPHWRTYQQALLK